MPIVASFGGLSAFGFGAFPGGDFESIATVTVGSGGVAIPEFTSIPSTYQHLHLRISGRGESSANRAAILLRFNSDSGSNYATHYLLGDGSAASAGAATSQTSGTYCAVIPLNTAIADQFGATVIDILDYANTSKYKTVRSLTGSDNNGTGASNADKGFIQMASALWMSSSAISSISLQINGAGDWAEHSKIALYGIKAP